MFPFMVVEYRENSIAQHFYRSAVTGREMHCALDIGSFAGNENNMAVENTKQHLFFTHTQAEAEDLLNTLARTNPGKTYMLFTSLMFAQAVITKVDLSTGKFDKNGKLPA